MREIRIRKVPDKIYRVARAYASKVDQSVPEFALEALDEKIGRLSDAEEAAKLPPGRFPRGTPPHATEEN